MILQKLKEFLKIEKKFNFYGDSCQIFKLLWNVMPIDISLAIMEIKNIASIKKSLDKKKYSCREMVDFLLEKIKKEDGIIHSFLEVFEKDARMKAGQIDERIAAGETDKQIAKEKILPLLGIPMAIKDNLMYEGHRASCGSKILENFVAPYSAAAVKKLEEAGAIIIGRTNMDEFAMGSSTENSAYGPTKNPRDIKRVPGGSSGGSAAAVAAGFAVAALGSDTGGSIRQPAAFCGVVGLKPTYGAVSRYGLVAMASSLDQIGPITKTVDDTALIFKIIKGRDIKDATSLDNEIKPSVFEIKNLKIGLPKEYFQEGIDKEVKEKIEEAIKKLEAAGARIEEISLPNASLCLAVYYLLMPAEVSSNLARFDGIRYGLSERNSSKDLFEIYTKSRAIGFGTEVKRRIMLGAFALSSGYYDAYYKKSKEIQKVIRDDFLKAFEKVDLLLTPTAPTTAFKLGEKSADPLTMYLSDIFTVSVNLAGLPAISVPSGAAGKLPIGIQFIGPAFSEDLLFEAGRVIEKKEKDSSFRKK